MTSAQRIALRHPCRLGVETAHPRFAHTRRAYSLVLTINSGYE